MRVLGIDPGSRVAGYGVVEERGGILAPVAWGVVKPPPTKELHPRLKYLFEAYAEIIIEYQPDEVAVEIVFFAENPRSALVLGHARAAAFLPALLQNLPFNEYTALQVKKALVGAGHAGKGQVAAMVCRLLNMKEIPKPEDVTDALAVAVTHLHAAPLRRKLSAVKEAAPAARRIKRGVRG